MGYFCFMLFYFITMLTLPYERKIFNLLVAGYFCLFANYMVFIDNHGFFYLSLVGLLGKKMSPVNIWTTVCTVCMNQIVLFKIGFLFKQYEWLKHLLLVYMWVIPIFQWLPYVHEMFMFYVCYKSLIGGCIVAHIYLFWTDKEPTYGKLVEGEHECIICCDSGKSDWIQLECDHTYHRVCIDEWLQQKLSCPLCRDKIESNKKFNTGMFMPFIV